MSNEILDESADDESEMDLVEAELEILPINKRLGNGLTKRSRLLVEQMVHFGLSVNHAAQATGMSARGARMALRRPGVMRFYQSELKLLRESEKPRSIIKMAELRDQKKSLKVSFEAARELGKEPTGALVDNRSMFVGQVNITPGYVIDISKHAASVQDVLRQAGSTKQAAIRTLEFGRALGACPSLR